ncbi:MAG: TrbI/VirB10 family protein [Pseudomonadota bacterium]
MNLFRDSRTRTIMLITAAVLIIGLVVGIYMLRFRGGGPETGANISAAPGAIRSIPGAFKPSEQYAKLQEEENVEKAKRAQQQGSSAIPTIIRADQPGSGQLEGQPTQTGQGFTGLGFKRLGEVEQRPFTPKQLFLDALKRSNCDAQQLQKAKELNVSVEELRQAGCSAQQLLQAGYNTADLLKAGFNACDLTGGSQAIDPKALRNAGYTAGELRGVGFNACQLKKAGYSAKDLCNSGYTIQELKGVGFTDQQIQDAGCRRIAAAGTAAGVAGGLPPGVTMQDIKNNGCSPEAIAREREQGVSAKAIMKAAGCSLSQLRAGGFTAKELKDEGFSARALKNAGFTPKELLDAGFTPKQLKDAGFSAKQLLDAGATPEQLKEAGFTPKQLKDAGLNAKQLKQLGFTAKDLADAGFSPKELKEAGFTPEEMAQAGLTPQQIAQAGFTPQELAGTTAAGATGAAGGTSAQLAATQARQEAQLAAQELLNEIQRVQTTMQTQATQLFTAWQSPTQAYVAGTPPREGATGTGAGGATPGAAGEAGNQVVLIKAGTILYGIVETSINSDEPGPVLSKVVTGRFKGAKLIGRIQTYGIHGQKVAIEYNIMNIRGFDRTIGINAYAIDADTARTGLSSYTNNRYLLRYGALFAASFLEGYGQAFLQSGSQIVSTAASTTAIGPMLNPTAQLLVALGNVGNRFGSILESQVVNRPPTVYVYSGTPIGILFTQDVLISKQLLEQQSG